jgi:3-dehydrocarnitine:acetyl-CoA trimethylamine transferase
MAEPIIISCAITGGADTKGINPAVPVTPQEIADQAIDAYNAGAAIVHIHTRDPETGKETLNPDLNRRLFGEICEIIRWKGCPVIINLTTGWGGRIRFNQEKPDQQVAHRTLFSPQERVQHILDCQPEMCSLDIATFNFGVDPFINTPAMLTQMAELIQAAGVKPELEVFDTGHIRLANHLIEQGVLTDQNPLFQLCLGIPWGAEASPGAMLAMRDMLPSHAMWSAFGIGRDEFSMVAAAAMSGGNVRVGLEDNLYVSRGVLAPNNAVLVEKAAQVVELIGQQVATVDEARKRLHLE